MLFPTPNNNPKRYIIVDEENNIIKYFRLKMAALHWIRKNQHFYFDSKLEVIKNDKL